MLKSYADIALANPYVKLALATKSEKPSKLALQLAEYHANNPKVSWGKLENVAVKMSRGEAIQDEKGIAPPDLSALVFEATKESKKDIIKRVLAVLPASVDRKLAATEIKILLEKLP